MAGLSLEGKASKLGYRSASGALAICLPAQSCALAMFARSLRMSGCGCADHERPGHVSEKRAEHLATTTRCRI
jgi:hypothetical protein